jgi:hypothetical protein
MKDTFKPLVEVNLKNLVNMELFELNVEYPYENVSKGVHIMRVPRGWLVDGVFVPEPVKCVEGKVLELKPINYSKPFTLEEINSDPRLLALQQHYDSTYGLLATDKPMEILKALPEELKKLMFHIGGTNEC